MGLDKNKSGPRDEENLLGEEEMVQLLEEMARQEQSVLKEALALSEAPGLDQVEDVLGAEWKQNSDPLPVRTPLKLVIAGLLSIAAVLLLFFMLPTQERPAGSHPLGSGPAGMNLGGDPLVLVYPVEPIEAWDALEWTSQVDAGSYGVMVVRASDEEVLLDTTVLETRIEFEDVDLSRWGSSLLIIISAFGDTRETVLATTEVEVHLTSR